MQRKTKSAPPPGKRPAGPPEKPVPIDRPTAIPAGNAESRWQRVKRFVWDKGGSRGGRR